MMFTKLRLAFFVFLLYTISAKAQNQPIGYWESLLPYNTCLGVATDGSTLFAICDQAFFSFGNTGTIETYSKVNGMSDLGMQSIGYDYSTSTVILAYSDGNIDLFKDNTFYNIPDFKLQTIAGAKTISRVYTENGKAYLSSSVGIIVIDLTDHVFAETITLRSSKNQVIPILGFTSTDANFYAATTNGLYTINKNNPKILDYEYWMRIDTVNSITNLATVNGTVFLSNQSTVFALLGDTLNVLYKSDTGISHIDAGNNRLLIGEQSDSLKVMTPDFKMIDSFPCSDYTVQAVQLSNNSYWVASPAGGLKQRTIDTGRQQTAVFIPIGPTDPNSFDIYSNDNNLYIAHGGFDALYVAEPNGHGISNLHNGKWHTYSQASYPPFDTLHDFVALAKDETTGTLYCGSYLEGLFIMNADGSYQLINQHSIFDTSKIYFGHAQRQVVGLALDQSRNLWITTMGSYHQLYVKTVDSQWAAFVVPNMTNGGPLVIDDNGQIWFVGNDGNGIAVYNPNGTILDKSDDSWYLLSTGVGYGNLPSANVNCVAKDLNNNIWIGTQNGIGIASGCSGPFTSSPPCDVQIPIVQYDQYAGYLFAGYNVTSIAVDGANRKWVGTDNGLWLLSPNADKIVYYFTQDNSPLPSNNIQKIAIDKVTGTVYIGTDMGLISYRSTATEGGTANQNVSVFPNPVPTDYAGSIAIKGLAVNADVRITDITGQLVYKTTAFGGQAVWNGKDYKGRRPQSGVYLIFVSSSDGSQTYSGKIVFMQ